jgi:hypothetical protein
MERIVVGSVVRIVSDEGRTERSACMRPSVPFARRRPSGTIPQDRLTAAAENPAATGVRVTG